jgi:hypothetical protein
LYNLISLYFIIHADEDRNPETFLVFRHWEQLKQHTTMAWIIKIITVKWVPSGSTLKMVAESSSEMSVTIYQNTRHIPENLNLPNAAVRTSYLTVLKFLQ